MSRQLTIEEVYKIIDQVEDESIRNLLRIAYGQLRAEYEFDRGWKKANLPDLIRLDERVKELEAALKPFAYYAKHIHDDVSDTASASGTVGDLRRAREVLGDK
jgi:hypothetical protein